MALNREPPYSSTGTIVNMDQSPTLVADIGGTNARFALSLAPGEYDGVRTIPTAQFISLTDALEYYFQTQSVKPKAAKLAIACPVNGDRISMTNHHWNFSQHQLRKRFFPTGLQVLNDFEAIAMSIPKLKGRQRLQIGGTEPIDKSPISILGPGTGLGVAQLIYHGSWQAICTEGGHAGLAPGNSIESKIFEYWMNKGEVLSREFFLSGEGLVRLYQAIVSLNGQVPTKNSPQAVQHGASIEEDPNCLQTLTCFCELLGSAAADQALAAGSQGGIYIAGGILKHIKKFFLASNFRQRFENKGAMKHYLEAIPCYLVLEEQPGLLGASLA